ncbi:MAG: ABC transporter ATP-binding protein/permease [Oscillospiraceae bacterium]|nr:ABC transporter ATP-binding protein/permease [Oscillospiraceae bacterium]
MSNDTKTQPKGFSLKLWKRLEPYFSKIKRRFIIGAVFMLINTVTAASYPLFTRYAIDNFVMQQTTDGIGRFAWIFGVVIIVSGLCFAFYIKQLMSIEVSMGLMIRKDCFEHLQKLPLSFFNKNSVGYLIGRVMSDTDRITQMVSWGFSDFVEMLCYIIFCVIFMFMLSPMLALIIVAMIPVAILISFYFQRKVIGVNRNIQEITAQISGAYNEGITGSKTSKTLVIESTNVAEFGKLSQRMSVETVRGLRLNAIMTPLVMSLGSVALAVLLYRGGLLVEEQLLQFGILSAFITYAVMVIEPVVFLTGIMSNMMLAQVGIERVTALLNEPETIKDTPAVIEKYGDTFNPKRENWEPIKGEITFEDVWFKYPDGDEYVLEDFSLTVPPGTTVALVGETGAGKSTIVNLACRFYEPTKGQVLIDGKPSKDRSQLWLHSSLGYVLQQPHLFSGTLMENIRYGKLDATDEEVIAAAKLVSADVVASRMPEGYHSDVGEGGDKLSTGEKQLVSFARAVLANPPIFVLDEATSSIDTETEQLIQNAISHILEGRTSFIIAHRLSTITRADLILVVEGGNVSERGTHAELLEKNGRYAQLYRAMQEGVQA